jgi:hypothetical protein
MFCQPSQNFKSKNSVLLYFESKLGFSCVVDTFSDVQGRTKCEDLVLPERPIQLIRNSKDTEHLQLTSVILATWEAERPDGRMLPETPSPE